jgi:hypothetical protein
MLRRYGKDKTRRKVIKEDISDALGMLVVKILVEKVPNKTSTNIPIYIQLISSLRTY